MRALLALAFIFTPSALFAGPWIDDIGRSTEMRFPGSSPVALQPNGHSVEQGVQAFDKLCLKTKFDRSAVQAIVKASDWGFAYRAEMVPFNEPVDVGGWNAPDATLRMASGIFFNKKPQCNLTFMPQGGANIDMVQKTMSAVLGTEPANANKQFDKKRKPKKYYSPEWAVSDSSGMALRIFVLPGSYNSGAFQLAVLKN
jgi:hypothetical protein